MSIPTDLRERVMQLEPDDRELPMDEIRESLKPDAGWSEAWAEEIDRRMQRHDAGETQAIPAEEVLERLRRRAEARRNPVS